MSQENVEMMRAIYEALGRNDLDGALALLPPDFELDYSGSNSPESGVFRGHDWVKGLFDTFIEVFSEFESFETELIEEGDVIVRVGGFRARGQASGAEVSASGATVWTLKGGRPVSMRLCQNKDEALEAAGRTAP